MLQAIYRIPFRIYLIVVMAAALAAALSYLLLSHMVDTAYEIREEALADNMDIAVSVLEDFHARAEAGEIPTDEARERVKVTDIQGGIYTPFGRWPRRIYDVSPACWGTQWLRSGFLCRSIARSKN